MQTKGFWLVIEGIDGAGKTSAITTVEKVFASLDWTYEVYREPGGTELGERIRHLLKDAKLHVYSLAEVLLYYAARIQLLATVVLPKLEQGISILLDRFELSTYAYQAGGRGVDASCIDAVSKACMPSQKPDLTIFLSVKPSLAYKRLCQRGDLDHMDTQSQTFFENVALNYEMLLDKYPNVLYIDANQDFDAVQSDIEQGLLAWIASK